MAYFFIVLKKAPAEQSRNINFLPSFSTVNKCWIARLNKRCRYYDIIQHGLSRVVSLLLQPHTNNHSLLLSERTQNGPRWQQSNVLGGFSTRNSPTPSPSMVCFIDPGNGDNGCYSHQWKVLTAEGNLSHFKLLSAKLHPITCFSRETLDQRALSI